MRVHLNNLAMKSKNLIHRVTLFGIGCFAAVSLLAHCQPQAQPRPGGLFAPPNTGAPKTRVGGGVRGGLMPLNTGAPKTRIRGGVRGGLMLPNTGAPRTRVGGGVRGGLMLPKVGAPKSRVGGGVRGGLPAKRRCAEESGWWWRPWRRGRRRQSPHVHAGGACTDARVDWVHRFRVADALLLRDR